MTATVDAPPRPDEEFDGTPEELRAEIEQLSAANAASPDPRTERRLVRLGHLAGMRLVDGAPSAPSFVTPDAGRLPAGGPGGPGPGGASAGGPNVGPGGAHGGGGLPEIDAAELSAGVIRAGLLRDGCLLVRGLAGRDRALAMAGEIDRAFRERERHGAGKRVKEGYYEEFAPHSRYGPVVGRGWIQQGGGVLAADAPRLSFAMMQLFRAAGLRELVSDYLGEPALISVHKTTLRKADPSVSGAWHQDGFFMGPVRSLNLWLSLSRCGDEAPGLDLLPTRLDHYLATNTDEAALDYVISQRKVDNAATAAGVPVIRPIFEPGDALFFDEVFLHQTGSDPAMGKPRYAIENWFFGGSAFPAEYAPIAV